MKIAILAHGYSGATLPLAKHLADKGHDVDLYYLCWHGATQMESIDYGKKMSALSVESRIDYDNTLYLYLSERVTVRIIPLFNPSNKAGKLSTKVKNTINSLHVMAIARRISARHYDFVNVVLYTWFDHNILNYLVRHGVNCCVSYHEVKTDLTCESTILPVVSKANSLHTPIVVHSQKTKEELLRLSDVVENRIHLIHFGLFESYLQYGEGKPINSIGSNFLLYLGFIKPYKGLKYLYEATKLLSSNNDIRIVVAGGGYDPILEKMRNYSKFVVINRFIDNAELVYLMKQSKGIVCPYIGASQSGLVQTALVFRKPIVATRVGAFPEIIKEGINGHLAKPADATDLAHSIDRLFEHTGDYDFTLPDCLSWDSISHQYLNLFHNCQIGT